MCESGSHRRSRSPSASSGALHTSQSAPVTPTLRWLSGTPFGWPEVPRASTSVGAAASRAAAARIEVSSPIGASGAHAAPASSIVRVPAGSFAARFASTNTYFASLCSRMYET